MEKLRNEIQITNFSFVIFLFLDSINTTPRQLLAYFIINIFNNNKGAKR
jgi:hypothetical protein